MDFSEKFNIYAELHPDTKNALELSALVKENGTEALVDKFIEAGLTEAQILGAVRATPAVKNETRGRKKKELKTGLSELFCSLSLGEANPDIASKIDDDVVGVCRAFIENDSQKRSGLSPSKLKRIMTSDSITVESISVNLGVGVRQARRYMKGVELLVLYVNKWSK